MIGAGGLFAPTIRYHQGRFYIICTNVICEGAEFDASNFYITTDDIWGGEWSDPIQVDLHGIDPSLYIEEDGRAYVQGSWRFDTTEQPTSTIKQWEVDLATGNRLSEVQEIWPGFSRLYTEGPHIYKKDGWFYLLVAEGGTFEHHHLSMARSREIWGPYESCPHNPVLTSYGKKEVVQDAGHGELFQDAEGQWWATVLGVRKFDDGTRYPLGRESFLTPVSWPQNEWPTFEHPCPGEFTRSSVAPPTKKVVKRFGTEDLAVSDCYIRTPVLEDYEWSDQASDQSRSVALRASFTDLTVAVGTATFVGKRQRRLDGSSAVATLIIDETLAGNRVKAGLAVYKDDFRNASISYDFETSNITLSLRNNTLDIEVLSSLSVGHSPPKISFRLKATLEAYHFAYCADGSNWEEIGSVDTREMTARDFTGTVFGIFALQEGGEDCDRKWVAINNFLIEE